MLSKVLTTAASTVYHGAGTAYYGAGRRALGNSIQLATREVDKKILETTSPTFNFTSNVSRTSTASGQIRHLHTFSPLTKSYSTRSDKRELHSLRLTPSEDKALGEAWDIPSDHMLTSTNIEGLRVGTWNILNEAYISHIKKAGWKESSLIEKNNTPSERFNGLSLREEECYEIIREAILGENPLDVLCLQECSDKMFQFLKKEFLGSGVQLFMTDGQMNNHVVTITSPNVRVTASKAETLWSRTYIPKNSVTPETPKGVEHFGPDKWRPAQVVKLTHVTENGEEKSYTITNIHISSAGKSDEYRIDRLKEVASGVAEMIEESDVFVILGDFNSTREHIEKTPLKSLMRASEDIHSAPDAMEERIDAIDHILTTSRLAKTLPLYERFDKVYQQAISPLIPLYHRQKADLE